MIVWMVIIVVLAASLAVIVWPIVAEGQEEASPAAYDIAIYKDQLDELKRDVERGVLSAEEARRAETEIARKLLAAKARAEQDEASGRRISPTVRRLAAAGVVLVTTGAALMMYQGAGAPGLPSQPFAAREDLRRQQAEQFEDIKRQIARLEAFLQDNPDDSRGWRLLGQVYLKLGVYDKALAALDRALDIEGPRPDLLVTKGIAHIYANDGLVTAQAEGVFRQALDVQPGNGTARYFLGLALAQRQDFAAAVREWQQALRDAPDGAPWVGDVKEQLQEAQRLAGTAPANPRPGPTADDVAAAGEMTSQDRAAMITGMVERLARRLETDPQDLDGWLQLIRSYGVLGREEEARQALDTARKVFAGNAEALTRLEEAAKELPSSP